MHHAGYGNAGLDNNDVFALCYNTATEDDDENGNGGGGGSTGSPRVVPHPTLPTLWAIATVPPGVTVTLGDIEQVCDYDPDTAWPDCDDALEEASGN